jgi:polysaccharide export outer membrane protein
MLPSALALAVMVASFAADSQGPVATGDSRLAVAVSDRSNVAAPPPGYIIGPDDRLTITFWRDTEMSGEVVVRPDGRISLPLLNDVEAAGLTPDELRERLLVAAKEFVAEPAPTVVVKEINSRRVFITGNVEKPGPYQLNVPMTVLQLIASAGGLREFVSGKNIVVVRTEAGRQTRLKFDYQAVIKGLNLRQNVELRPGDTVVVP